MGRHRKDGKYTRGAEFKKLRNKQFFCNCNKCGKYGMKTEMPGLYIRKTAGDSHRILCRLRNDCLPGFLAELGVKMPE